MALRFLRRSAATTNRAKRKTVDPFASTMMTGDEQSSKLKTAQSQDISSPLDINNAMANDAGSDSSTPAQLSADFLAALTSGSGLPAQTGKSDSSDSSNIYPVHGGTTASPLASLSLGEIAELMHKPRESLTATEMRMRGAVLWAGHSGAEIASNPREAALLWRDAANLGDMDARFNLGAAFSVGKGVSQQSDVRAVSMWSLAARRGHPQSQLVMGHAFAKGTGVPNGPDSVEALNLYRLAAQNGLHIGHYFAGNLLAGLDESSLPVDDLAANEEYTAGAEAGEMYCAFNLGARIARGVGTLSGEPDPKEGYRWSLKGAQAGLPRAQFNVGASAFLGRGTGQSFVEAAEWWTKAAKAGFPWAQLNLGNLYRQGRGVEQSNSQALRWYTAASESKVEKVSEAAQALLQALKTDMIDTN